jgi:cellulose synthase/poly-beta-1,6-N-acetylglucosamine synthase-like glycosyltransferase
MDISLIIATRNRSRQLVRCLDAVQQMRFDRAWEFIIVDNGSGDDTGMVVQGLIDNISISTTYAVEQKPGKSNALNTALKIARGEVLAFTDDDCYPAPDFLSSVSSAFKDPALGYVTGRILLHDPEDARMTIKESTTPVTFPARSFIPCGEVSGANMAFRREVLCHIGGFDPFFGPGSRFQAVAEDLDLAGRASAAGWKGQYRPEIVVRHHHGRKASDIPRLVKSYGIGIGAYHMKLLLDGGEFRWFIQSLYQVRRRLRASRISVLWEPVGAARYAYAYLTQALRKGHIRA